MKLARLIRRDAPALAALGCFVYVAIAADGVARFVAVLVLVLLAVDLVAGWLGR